jgi:hypothetical protein
MFLKYKVVLCHNATDALHDDTKVDSSPGKHSMDIDPRVRFFNSASTIDI